MTVAVTHTKVSGLADGADSSLVLPSDWNAAHTLSGTGTGVLAALSVNIGTSGSFVVNGGAGGTPSGLTLTNATGLPVSSGITGAGTGVLTALAVNVGSAGAPVVNGGALGTPSSGTATNLTGLPVSSGVSGLGSGVATFLATPSSANLLATLTTKAGTGSAVFDTSPTIATPTLTGNVTYGLGAAKISGGQSLGNDFFQVSLNGSNQVSFSNGGLIIIQKDAGQIYWSGIAPDTGLSRPMAGKVEVNSSVTGDLRDISVRGVFSSLHTHLVSDFSVASSTTPVSVPGLQAAVLAGSIYELTAILDTTSDVAAGAKVAIDGTATASLFGARAKFIDGTSVTLGARITALGTASGVTAITNARIEITGKIVVTTSGNINVKISQNASSAAATTVLASTSTFTVDPISPLNLVMDGDSIAANMGTQLGTSGLTVYNFAVPGSVYANMLSRASLVDAVTFNYPALMILIGHNDIALGGYVEATFVSNIQTYALARQAVGKKIFICTVLPSNINGGFNTTRNSLNTALKTMITSNGFTLMDIGDTGSTMGADAAASDLTLYSDGIHPTALGNTTLFTDKIIPALQAAHYR